MINRENDFILEIYKNKSKFSKGGDCHIKYFTGNC